MAIWKLLLYIVKGAYILDSIANFNDTVGAQLLPETYQNQLPDFSRDVILNSFKGDFIGVIGRGVDQPLYEMVTLMNIKKNHLTFV